MQHCRFEIESRQNPQAARKGRRVLGVSSTLHFFSVTDDFFFCFWCLAGTHVAHMTRGDFYGSEQSAVMEQATAVEIVLETDAGDSVVLKPSISLEQGEVIDAAFLSVKELRAFYEQEIDEALDSELLLSLHLKATMMKVSDPIMFGHAIRVFYQAAFEKHGAVLEEIGANPNQGLSSLYETIKSKLPEEQASTIIADFEACYENRPWLAMVNSDKGITNLHAPNDIIIDASMPVVIRDSGKMWNKMGELEDTKCLIPDRCYATIYQEVISYVKSNGQFDVATMGNVVRAIVSHPSFVAYSLSVSVLSLSPANSLASTHSCYFSRLPVGQCGFDGP